MKVSCTLRNIFDIKYRFLVLMLLTYWTMLNFNRQRIVTLLVILLVWSYAFTCSPSGNLFIRVFESNLLMVLASFLGISALKYQNII